MIAETQSSPPAGAAGASSNWASEAGPLRVPGALAEKLCCPVCYSPLRAAGESLRCAEELCGRVYPVHAGRPVLIAATQSIFDPEGIVRIAESRGNPPSSWGSRLPKLAGNPGARANYRRFVDLLLASAQRPDVLVIGGGQVGAGMTEILAHPALRCVESDVYLSGRTSLACDGHNIPFVDATFDGVVVQAVLEHVLDPARVVAEIHRVLKPAGIVYAETPFMQQVHLGAHDFTRFTHLGHRRLFRYFHEISSGAAGGPGSALAWSLQHFARSAARGPLALRAVTAAARLTLWWLKHLDPWLMHTPAGLDAACGLYFLGERSVQPLSDRELVALYRGAQR